MKIKDIISQGKVYADVTRVLFDVTKKDNISLNYLIESIDKLKVKLSKTNDDYNNILFVMLSDKYLIDGIIENYNKYNNVYDAVHTTIDFYRNALKTSNHDYLNQRVIDLDNLEYIILANLNDYNYEPLTNDSIIVCNELYPSYLMDNIKNIKGIVALKGGVLAHSAILARAKGIPYVLVDELDFDYSKKYYIDTTKYLITNDENVDININNEEVNITQAFKDSNIKVYANVFSNDDLPKVIKYNFHGIGLYRTEFIFMNSSKPMPKEIQENIYLEAAIMLHPKPVVFRTFDLGDDKKVSYLTVKGKGILNYLNNLELFTDQIKALVKANVDNNISIMFPMIKTIDEYRLLSNIVKDIAVKSNSNMPKLGMMLETKEALLNLEDFKEVEFISLGTNDLTKELYNINREDISRSELYLTDLLKHIKKVVLFAEKYNIKLSICGELASLPESAKLLLEAGMTNFSVSPECYRAVLDEFNSKNREF